MPTVKFIATTITSRGTFGKGDSCSEFTEKEAKDLQRLSSVESPEPTTIEEPKVKEKKKKVKKVEKDELQGSTEK